MQPITIHINVEAEKEPVPAGVVMAPHPAPNPSRMIKRILRDELQMSRDMMKPVIESTVASAVNSSVNSTLSSMPVMINKEKKMRRKRKILTDEGWSNNKRSVFRESDGIGYFEV